MASTFTENKTALDEVSQRTVTNIKREATAKSTMQQAATDLAAMLTAYTAFATAINADATANPSDPAVQAMKAEKDRLVADFQALKTRVDMRVAISAAIDTAIAAGKTSAAIQTAAVNAINAL